jgi:ParB family chromosome partitioning protein
MAEFENNAIFWIEVEKIHPNPYQPRKEFDERHLQDLADSIRQYGVLQPLVVTRKDAPRPDGGLDVEYELIAGERRLRASKIAGVQRVPAIIQSGVADPRLKLELAIIENLQREDLNPVDRALSFARLANEFGLKHVEIAKKVGKSREYVSNSLRLLALPSDILDALSSGRITEGHARPLMMLGDRAEEQSTLFKEILFKKLTVREAETIARSIAKEKVRKKFSIDPETEQLEKELANTLGTRVSIEKKQVGGKIVIDYFTTDDLRVLLSRMHMGEHIAGLRALKDSMDLPQAGVIAAATPVAFSAEAISGVVSDPAIAPLTAAPLEHAEGQSPEGTVLEAPYDDRTTEERHENESTEDPDLYSVKNFGI